MVVTLEGETSIEAGHESVDQQALRLFGEVFHDRLRKRSRTRDPEFDLDASQREGPGDIVHIPLGKGECVDVGPLRTVRPKIVLHLKTLGLHESGGLIDEGLLRTVIGRRFVRDVGGCI